MQMFRCRKPSAAIVAVLFGAILFGTTAQAKKVVDEVFAYADGSTEVVATCIVGAAKSAVTTAAIAECLCEASGDDFAFCFTLTDTTVSPGIAIGVGEAFGAAGTSLRARLKTSGKRSDVRIDVTASCSLRSELSLETVTGGPSVGFLDGKTAKQAAIFMWPVIGNRAVAEPKRLCARSTEFEFVEEGRSDRGQLTANSKAMSTFNFAAEREDFGLSGGFQWVVENVGKKNKHLNVGVAFLVVAVVDSRVLSLYGDGVGLIGGLTSATLDGSALHALSYTQLRVHNGE